MAPSLDLATVLFMLKTSYVAGGASLAYVRWRARDSVGAGAMAAAFLVQAAGSTLAGFAEVDRARYAILSLADLGLGILGYTLLFTGAYALSRNRAEPWLRAVHVIPLLVLAAAWATGFHTVNAARATLFNAAAATALLALAVRFALDHRREPLAVRCLLALVFGAAGLLAAGLALEFATQRFALAPTTGFVLMITLKVMVALFAVILVMERANRKLDRLAHTDPLTGIANRRAFYDTVPAMPNTGDAIVLFDADRFKRLNDDWGHDFGDEVLRAIAMRLAACAGGDALVARYGGEEFILYLPATDAARALAIADEARRAVAAAVLQCGRDRVQASVSAGVAVNQGGVALRSLIRQADTALYEAKRAGGNSCRCYAATVADREPEAASAAA